MIHTSTLEFIANTAGRCALNGAPARLDWHTTRRGYRLAKVSASDGRNSALFSLAVAVLVLTGRSGRFDTRN